MTSSVCLSVQPVIRSSVFLCPSCRADELSEFLEGAGNPFSLQVQAVHKHALKIPVLSGGQVRPG